jgi:late competence protein required for DNA uptake (superfamily II DNA/RNA helicase)
MIGPCQQCGGPRRVGHVNTDSGATWFCYCPACVNAGRVDDRELRYLHEMIEGWLMLRRTLGKRQREEQAVIR